MWPCSSRRSRYKFISFFIVGKSERSSIICWEITLQQKLYLDLNNQDASNKLSSLSFTWYSNMKTLYGTWKYEILLTNTFDNARAAKSRRWNILCSLYPGYMIWSSFFGKKNWENIQQYLKTIFCMFAT